MPEYLIIQGWADFAQVKINEAAKKGFIVHCMTANDATLYVIMVKSV